MSLGNVQGRASQNKEGNVEESTDFSACVTNFSIQYNFGCAGMATAIMLSQSDKMGPGIIPDIPQPAWAHSYLLSIVFVGSIVGMMCMGALGDVIGIKRALVFTNSLTVVGALSSALLSWGSPQQIWGTIAVSRFILGIGVGGGYPLSAAKAAQGAARKNSIKQAAKAFFWQGPGSAAPYAVALALLLMPSRPGVTGIQFRLLLGLGALPAFVVVWCALREPSMDDTTSTTAREVNVKPARDCSSVGVALGQQRYWRKLLGTAGTWFLFDVAFYALIIFAPTVVTELLGESDGLASVAGHSLIFVFLSLTGFLVGIYSLVHLHVEAKFLNTAGFVFASSAFALTSLVFEKYRSAQTVLFLLVCSLYVSLAAGCNIATFVLPVETFPPDVRGTFGGLSSASGKLGAMVGTIVFPALVSRYRISGAMLFMSMVCALGAICSHFCLKSRSKRGDDEDACLVPSTQSRHYGCGGQNTA